MKENARELRKQQTVSEQRLWQQLRKRRLRGFKFRRQHCVGPFIVDFICLERLVIIELDGGQHAQPEAKHFDGKRSQWLEEEGYQVLRFWNSEVFQNLDGVLQVILRVLETSRAGRSPSP